MQKPYSFAKLKMRDQPSYKLILWTLVTISLLSQGWGAKCTSSEHTPTVRQTQVGTVGMPPKYTVEVQNNCPMCPVINVHLKCGSFPQELVNPRLLKVLGSGDCVVNAGLPLQPLQKLSFNYTHSKYLLRPNLWFFQCE